MSRNQEFGNSAMYHGTRAENLGGFIFPGAGGKAYATSDPESARAYGETRVGSTEDVGKPAKVYKVVPVQPNEVVSKPGNKDGETHYVSEQGFMITGEHK